MRKGFFVKIAVDYQSASGQKTGIGSAAENMVRAMREAAPDIEFLLYQSGKEDLKTPGRLAWENISIPMRALKDKPDVLYSPGFAPAFFSPVPQVVTLHDLIGMAFPGNQGKVSSFYWSSWLPMTVKRAKRVVASSEHTRRDAEKFLKIPASAIRVVPLAVAETFRVIDDSSAISRILEKYKIRGPFFIAVGTLEPRKNYQRLLEAYAQLKAHKKNGFSLVIVGKPGAAAPALQILVRELGLEKEIKFLGYIDNEELTVLYNAALGYVVVSHYEGFGLPVLEGMSCGLSGIVANNTSLPEVAGDAALAVRPESIDDIAHAMRDLFENASLRSELKMRALSRSKNYSMRKTADQMIGILKETANS
jgi:glycosyltransferase involved in cell wall biosynthesis